MDTIWKMRAEAELLLSHFPAAQTMMFFSRVYLMYARMFSSECFQVAYLGLCRGSEHSRGAACIQVLSLLLSP